MTNYIIINKYHGNTTIYKYETYSEALKEATKKQKKCKTEICIYKVIQERKIKKVYSDGTYTEFETTPIFNAKEGKEIEENKRVKSFWHEY